MLKKILLIFAGIFVALIILEISIQTAGFLIANYQNYKNNKELKNKSQYSIICLGESTTFGKYPDYLQKILNKKYPNKFSVIDCGIPGVNLENILGNLDGNIVKYKPDFAICMMGINNGFLSLSDNSQESKNEKYEKFKIYKLYKLFKNHLGSRLKTKEVYADNIVDLNMNYVYELYAQKKYSDAEQICEKMLKIKQDDYYSYAFLAMLYYYHLNKKNIAYKMALNIIKTNKRVPSYWKQIMYEIIIDYSVNKNDVESAKRCIDKLINDKDVIFSGRMYWFIKDIITLEQKAKFFQKMSADKENLDQYYGLIAIESMYEKNYKKAEEYFTIAEDIRVKYASKHTYELYKLILKKLIDNNIKVICMQYPVRSIESLKNILKDEDYFNKITFVSNEYIFKQLLQEKKYDEIFRDQFAGDFGHCTDLGNTMIADNLANSLRELLNL
ncbi:MAG: hypothetical protein PHR82_05325 [Endomicrobiaceae bacterium]|nr:hypothetical protein [Endomicrobiaceae bacterium]